MKVLIKYFLQKQTNKQMDDVCDSYNEETQGSKGPQILDLKRSWTSLGVRNNNVTYRPRSLSMGNSFTC